MSPFIDKSPVQITMGRTGPSSFHDYVVYDVATGSLGLGFRYGEHSLNGRPLQSGSVEVFWGTARGPLYDPFRA